jgi:hypothetical protein
MNEWHVCCPSLGVDDSCDTIAQVRRRSTKRLLTALLLVLAAFGVGGSSFSVARFTLVVVCAQDELRGKTHSVSAQRAVPLSTPEPIERKVARRDQSLHDTFIGRELFQRPPPVPSIPA